MLRSLMSATPFQYQDILPLGDDPSPYRLLTKDFVSTFEAGGHAFLKVEPHWDPVRGDPRFAGLLARARLA